MCIRDSKIYHSSLPQLTHQNCKFFYPPLIPFHSNTNTFHTTPLIFTVSFHLCFSHSEQIKFALSKYIQHLSPHLLNIYSPDISYTDRIHTFSPKDRRTLTAITTFSEACISIPGKRYVVVGSTPNYHGPLVAFYDTQDIRCGQFFLPTRMVIMDRDVCKMLSRL